MYNWTNLSKHYGKISIPYDGAMPHKKTNTISHNKPNTPLTSRTHGVIIREIDLRELDIAVNEKLCFCGSGKPHYNCHNKVRENTAMAYLFEAFKMIDKDINSANEYPECNKGCAECCCDYFEVSAPEYFAILMHLQKKRTFLPISSIRKVHKAAQSFRPAFPAFESWSELSSKRILSHPCIFLDNRDSRCRIYEVRPLVCRLYGYYTSYGNCISAKNQLTFVPDDIATATSRFLDTHLGNSFVYCPPA